MFKPVERASLVEEVAGQIRQLVLDGRLKPDEKLPSQQDLCAQFSVSRTCVREAIRLLEGYGILESRPGGTFVRTQLHTSRGLLHAWMLSHDFRLEEFLEVRIALEGTSAALSAQRATLPEVKAIGRGLDQMRAAAEHSNWDALVEAELSFHRAISDASGNALLADLLVRMNAWLDEVGRAVLSIPERKERVVTLHEPIYDAIQARDSVAARLAMESAIRGFAEEFGISLE